MQIWGERLEQLKLPDILSWSMGCPRANSLVLGSDAFSRMCHSACILYPFGRLISSSTNESLLRSETYQGFDPTYHGGAGKTSDQDRLPQVRNLVPSFQSKTLLPSVLVLRIFRPDTVPSLQSLRVVHRLIV